MEKTTLWRVQKKIYERTEKVFGYYTHHLFNNLQKGAVSKIERPCGSFSYENCTNKNQIWIAGGIGITPFISFIKSIKPESEYTIKLFYCVRREDEAIYLNLFKQYEQSLNNTFQVIPFYSEENGYINQEYIFKHVTNFKE